MSRRYSGRRLTNDVGGSVEAIVQEGECLARSAQTSHLRPGFWLVSPLR
jgi:hypothetical protein